MERLERLTPVLNQLLQDDDQIAVLRGQLYVEVILIECLAIRFPGFDRLAPSIDFSKKARLALDEQIIDDQTYQLLNGLGRLRNSFSHPPLKFEITDADIAAFIRTAPPWYAPFINIPDHPAIGFDFRKPGMSSGRLKVRSAIGLLYSHLAAVKEVLSDDPSITASQLQMPVISEHDLALFFAERDRLRGGSPREQSD